MSTRSKWAALISLNVVVFVILVFAATEWFIERKRKVTILYHQNADFRQELLAGQRFERNGVSYRIGPHSMRGSPPPLPKPEDELRLFVLGGSSVFDYLVEPSWGERLGDELKAAGRAGVKSYNGGVPGFSIREVLGFYRHRVRKFSPDVVLVYLGWNDLKYMRPFRYEAKPDQFPPTQDAHDIPWYRFLLAPRPERNFRAIPVMLEKLKIHTGFLPEDSWKRNRLREKRKAERKAKEARARGESVEKPPPAPKGPPPLWSESGGLAFYLEHARQLASEVRADGARIVFVPECTLMGPDTKPEDQKRIAYRYLGLSPEDALELVKLMRAQTKAHAPEWGAEVLEVCEGIDMKSELFADHVHLTKQGSALLAKKVAKALAPKLAEP